MRLQNIGRYLLCAALGLATEHCVRADDYHDWMDKLKALDTRCEQVRAQKLAPIRRAMIREFVKDRHYTLHECQENAMRYGESSTGPNRNFIRGLYYDLPECQQA